MFIYERVFAHGIKKKTKNKKKSKKMLPTFYMDFKKKDHTINNTLFPYITAGCLFLF